MRTRKVVCFVVLLAAISLAACRGNSPSAPSQTPTPTPRPNPEPHPTPEPNPDPTPQPQYPDLPHKECAKNLETGEELTDCRMWAELQLGIKPPRGSMVKMGDQYCPDPRSTCLEFDMKYGFKGVDDHGVEMAVTSYFSMDGRTAVGGPIFTGNQSQGESIRHFGPRILQVIPKYLLIKLDHAQACGSCEPAEEGWIAFLLDYK